ncbi:hypothetical protein H4R18_002787 [Coemansia javaensis]|uniref:Ubiquitin carboxyl-terminal hydrolase n=1 Tax=Coemansia javaensis TaxID=2761396 RepID=A0A9W8HHE4_9FUNG|nr:hypothetical protein H4R18_002787 [Coemansia javaensis]
MDAAIGGSAEAPGAAAAVAGASDGCPHIGARTKAIIDRLKVLVPYAYVCRHRQALLQGRRGAAAATLGAAMATGGEPSREANREATPAAAAGEGDRSRKRLVDEMPAPTCHRCSTPADRLHVCLSCDFFGCWRRRRRGEAHIAAHLRQAGHPFALDFVHLQVFCRDCGDYVYDAAIAGWLMGTQIRWHAALCDSAESEAKRPRIVSTGADLSPAQARYLREHGSVSPCAGVRGLYNLGATCYLSVVLQALVHNPLLRGWMLSDGHHPSRCRVGRRGWAGPPPPQPPPLPPGAAAANSDSDGEELLSGRVGPPPPAAGAAAAAADAPPACMACELEAAFQAFFAGPRAPLGPVRLLRAMWVLRPDLAGYGQQDAHEWLVAILDTLHAGFTENDSAAAAAAAAAARPVHHSHLAPCPCLVHQVFGGVLQSTVTCSQCGNATHAHDPVLDLSLDIPPPDHRRSDHAADAALADWLAARHRQRSPGSAWRPPQSTAAHGHFPVVSLQDCLAHYTRPERLPPGSYTCSRCRPASPAATKQLCMKELPPVLTFQLKRFGHDARAGPLAPGGGSAGAGASSGAIASGSSATGSAPAAAAAAAATTTDKTSSSSSSSSKIDTFVRLPLHIDMTPYTASAQAAHAQTAAGLRASGGAATTSTGNALPPAVGGVPVRSLDGGGSSSVKPDDAPGLSKDTPVPVLDGPGGSTTLGKRRTDATHSNPSCSYRLFAVIDHIGHLDTGHYTAYANHRGQWYKFDDATVTRADLSDVLGFAEEAKARAGRPAKGRAYMAFYVKTILDYHDGAATHVGSASPTPLAAGMGASNTRINESGEWIEDAGVVRTRINPNGDLKIERRGRKKGSTNNNSNSNSGAKPTTAAAGAGAAPRKKKASRSAMPPPPPPPLPPPPLSAALRSDNDNDDEEFLAAGSLGSRPPPPPAQDSDSDGEALWAQISKHQPDDLVPMASPPLYINPAHLASAPPPPPPDTYDDDDDDDEDAFGP